MSLIESISHLICNSIRGFDLTVQHLRVLVIKSGVAGGVQFAVDSPFNPLQNMRTQCRTRTLADPNSFYLEKSHECE